MPAAACVIVPSRTLLGSRLAVRRCHPVYHPWFPTGGQETPGAPPLLWDSIHHLILPVLVLSLVFVASWSRYLRSSVLQVLHQDYLRAARAKGLSARRVVFKHALRNALVPLVTVVALDVGTIFGGAVVTEQIFDWPGLGTLFNDSLSARDYPVLMAMLVLSSASVTLCNEAATSVCRYPTRSRVRISRW